jgi:hypothetical protein
LSEGELAYSARHIVEKAVGLLKQINELAKRVIDVLGSEEMKERFDKLDALDKERKQD